MAGQTYRVVRFHAEPGVGVIEEVLGQHLSMDEAQSLADSEAPVTPDEHILVEDEGKDGLEAIIRMDSVGGD